MPTATRPHIAMKPSLSYSSVSSTMRFNVKLAPTINSVTVISFEKRADQKIWYMLKIQPQSQLYNKSRSYVIARKYEDFAQLSQSLQERFSSSKHRAGSRLPPKIKSRLNILPASKQLHVQRAEEINQFLGVLFQTQSIITESYIVLEFFGIQKTDLVYEKENSPILPDLNNNTSKWKRLRCTSFLARSPPSSTALSSLCSQAANKIIPSWHRSSSNSPQPSLSTPSARSHGSTKEGLIKKSKSSTCVHPLMVVPSSNNNECMAVPSPTCSQKQQQQLKSTIKIKVIYDVDNIIVIQVPRTITLQELRSRIAQKFSDQQPMDQVVLLYNDSMSSCCSISSNSMALPAVLITKEQDLVQLFSSKWNRLEKVTLRCIP